MQCTAHKLVLLKSIYLVTVGYSPLVWIRTLVTSDRDAYVGGYVNGQCKAVIHDLVSLVRQEGLCDRHNLRLNV